MTAPIQIEPWTSWLVELSTDLRPQTAYPARILLDRVTKLRSAGDAERTAWGLAARRLLAFALDAARNDAWFVADAVRTIALTYETAPAESDRLLRGLFTADRLERFGAFELARYAESITSLAPQAPLLVRDLYIAAFRYEETSREETQLVPSAVMPLRSNRKQDYEGGLYALGQQFGAFLAAAPGPATSALIAALETYHKRERYRPFTGPVHVFDMHGVDARVQSDGSGMWDEYASHRHNDALQMLDAFSGWVARLAAGEAHADIESRRRSQGDVAATGDRRILPPSEAQTHLEEIVATIIFDNELAVIWRKLLEAGTAHPDRLRDLIVPLAWAAPILVASETTVAAGEYLSAVYPVLTQEERARIEHTILYLLHEAFSDRRDDSGTRARLLGCLPEELIATREARSELAALRTRDAIPENRRRGPLIGMRSLPASGRTVEEHWMKEAGVDVDADPNRVLLAHVRTADEFSSKFLNDRPEVGDALALFPTLRGLRESLSSSSAHAKVRRSAEQALARACAKIVGGAPATTAGGLGEFVRTELLVASRSDRPAPGEGELINGTNGWSPAPRIEAAEGLTELCRRATHADLEVLEAVRRLSIDPASAVRAAIFWRINALWSVAPDFVWQALEHLAAEETNTGVLEAALHSGLSSLQGVAPERVAELTAQIADRAPQDKAGTELRNHCAALFTSLAVWDVASLALDRVARITHDPGGHAEEAKHILHQLREMLVHGDVGDADARVADARQRSLRIVSDIVTHAAERFAALRPELSAAQSEAGHAALLEQLRELASVLDSAGAQLYFAAKDVAEGGETSRSSNEDEPPITVEQIKRLYVEGGTIIDALADAGIAHLAHHLLELLEILVPHDPGGVFLRIARAVRGARDSNYQYDSLAEGIVVRLVTRYLAEYQDVLEASAECRQALLDVLDIFIQAGWPSARQLTYRLEEVYR